MYFKYIFVYLFFTRVDAIYTAKCNFGAIFHINISHSKHFKNQVFEKWKEENDSILKDRIRQKKQTERRQKLQQVKEKEEKKKDSISAFAEW